MEAPYLKIDEDAKDISAKSLSGSEKASSGRSKVSVAIIAVSISSVAVLSCLQLRSRQHPVELKTKHTKLGGVFKNVQHIHVDADQEAAWGGLEACPKRTAGTCRWLGCSARRGPTVCTADYKCECATHYCSLEQGKGENCVPFGTCTQDTGGTCDFRRCKSWRGPTDCRYEKKGMLASKKCMCKPGWCAVGGVCVSNATQVIADVVPLDGKHKKFPGAHAHVKTALSCAGGGSRAQAICMGLLRAFENTGLMKSIDMLVSTSGGTWAAAPYMFADRDLDELLGKPTTDYLSRLTLNYLAEPPGQIAKTGHNNVVEDITSMNLKAAAYGGISSLHSVWSTAIAKYYLGPFGLGDRFTYMAGSEEDVARIKKANPQMADKNFNVPSPDRPKVYVISGTIIRPRNYKNNPDAITGLQISPDYTGSPFYINNEKLHWDPGPLHDDLPPLDAYVGGGLVETFAYGGPPPADSEAGEGKILPAPGDPLSLADAVAMSSNFYAGNFGGFESIEGISWAVGGDDGLRAFQLGDGGLLDNDIMHPALQRGATRFVWMIPTQLKFDLEPDYCGGKESLGTDFDNDWASDDISDKFGHGVCGGGFFRCHNKVFDDADYIPLLCKLKTAILETKKPILRAKLKLVDNAYWQIEGGKEIEVMLVYNTKTAPFIEALPEETQAEIEKGDEGKFPNFPMYDIFAENGQLSGGMLTFPQINLLAAHTEYLVTSEKKLYEDFLDV